MIGGTLMQFLTYSGRAGGTLYCGQGNYIYTINLKITQNVTVSISGEGINTNRKLTMLFM
jgi:hypothetical protein